MEIHMPFGRAKPAFSKDRLWVWPKFDKRPAGFLIFMEGFAPCIWYPEASCHSYLVQGTQWGNYYSIHQGLLYDTC